MKGLLHQIVSGVAELHETGTMHRDLKPSNVLINAKQSGASVLLADFSSAVSEAALRAELYGSKAANAKFPNTDDGDEEEGEKEKYEREEERDNPFKPSQGEETLEYAPPEVILCQKRSSNSASSSNNCAYSDKHPFAYDIWSVGVIFLEFILGTANIFLVDQRTAVMVRHQLSRVVRRGRTTLLTKDEESDFNREVEEHIYRAALAEFCIYNYTAQELLGSRLHLVAFCSPQDLARAIQRRDPLGRGFHDFQGLDLISKLLAWDPADRISMKQALLHPYFVGHSQREQPAYTKGKAATIVLTDMHLSPEGEESRNERFGVTVFDFINEPVRQLMLSVDNTRHLKLGLSSWYSNISTINILSVQSTQGSRQAVITPHSDTDNISFWCPSCGHMFTDFLSCDAHIKSRKHGTQCLYSKRDLSQPISERAVAKGIMTGLDKNEEHIPKCISENVLLPIDPYSGWCELQECISSPSCSFVSFSLFSS